MKDYAALIPAMCDSTTIITVQLYVSSGPAAGNRRAAVRTQSVRGFPAEGTRFGGDHCTPALDTYSLDQGGGAGSLTSRRILRNTGLHLLCKAGAVAPSTCMLVNRHPSAARTRRSCRALKCSRSRTGQVADHQVHPFGKNADCGLCGVPLGNGPTGEDFQRVLGWCPGICCVDVDAQSRVCGQFKRFEAQVQVANNRVVEPFAASSVVLHVVTGLPGAELLAAG